MEEERKTMGAHVGEIMNHELEATRLARGQQATNFLDNVLLPAIKERGEIDSKELDKLLIAFKQKAVGLGADFELGHVWGIVYQRVLFYEKLAETNGDKLPSQAALTIQAWELLTQIELGEGS